jgi:hypothetical protein
VSFTVLVELPDQPDMPRGLQVEEVSRPDGGLVCNPVLNISQMYQYPVPSAQYPVPSTQYPVPSTQYPVVCFRDCTRS